MTSMLLAGTTHVDDDVTRRQFLIGGLSAAALLVGCGGPDSGSPVASPAGDGFPVTIEHKHGSTEIPSTPQRVVAVGLVEQDPLLALGVIPVATTEWFGEHPGAIHPWAREALGNAPLLEVQSAADGFQFERIAALRPDLILALAGVDVSQSDYGKLAQIAPTVIQPAGLVSSFADPSVFLTEVGFAAPEQLRMLTREQGYAQISRERLDLLDVDLLYVAALKKSTADEFVTNPLYRRLDVYTEGRDIVVIEENDAALYGAVSSFLGVLSFQLVFDRLVPRLAAAVDGDPRTAANP